MEKYRREIEQQVRWKIIFALIPTSYQRDHNVKVMIK